MQKEEPQRLNTTIIKPIVYGNVSRYLGKKREEDGRTHVWTAFLRPFDPNDDISLYVKRVQFKLHESYSNPIRTVTKPPFEVTETGWGEFDIAMKVRFQIDFIEIFSVSQSYSVIVVYRCFSLIPV